MLVLCAVEQLRPRLDACNYIGDAENVQPYVRAMTAHPLLANDVVQTAATNLREHATSPAAPNAAARAG